MILMNALKAVKIVYIINMNITENVIKIVHLDIYMMKIIV